MKFAFYKQQELDQIITKLFATDSKDMKCKIGYSEELDGDGVEFFENGVLVRTVEVKDIFDVLSAHLGEEISRYDVMEVGDFGEGFVFFFKERVASTKPKFKVA
ncbi:hypothetical protein ACFVS2_26805 [Brevibacillus sp. NPDC058079]|uniref:hypothetical protein n=1 Tax=Brevibacillus sp. NPDC058079 TaxID=3346330 RepID=UPI0036EB0BD9